MKTEFIWGTDIHLDVLDESALDNWVKDKMSASQAEAILLTGDISIGPKLIDHLRKIRIISGKKIYYTLGNHDYWDSSIVQLRAQIDRDDLKNDGIIWMGSTDYIAFGEHGAIVGHDGWYDALNGDFSKSRFVMRDWFRIDEFKNAIHDLLSTCRKLAASSAFHVERSCEKAIANGKKKIIIMTHFPPFAEACFYRGKKSDDHALPWYSSKLMGETLLSLSAKYPDTTFTVLCGHTHAFADISPRSNLRVVVGESDYGSPRVNPIGVEE